MITPSRPHRLIAFAILTMIFANSVPAFAQRTESRRSGSGQGVDRVRVGEARYLHEAPKRVRTRSRIAAAAHGEYDAPAQIRQVSYGCDGGCGPVCDCGEVSCGIEVGCGAEGGCGVPGCDSCSLGIRGGGLHDLLNGEPACGAEFLSDCGCDSCNTAYNVDRFPLLLPILRIEWNRFEFFTGSHAFTNQLNFAENNAANPAIRSGSGSFGFHQGFNEGRSLKRWFGLDLASQMGVRATQSNLSGTEFTSESRYQIFVTAGLFRRVDYGLQYGVVFDYLNEDWYYQADVTQLRGELSWKTGTCHAFGFRFASALSGSTTTAMMNDGIGGVVTRDVSTDSVDQYRAFYRRLLNNNGHWTAFLGTSDSDHTIMGTELSLPIRSNFSLATSCTYMNDGDSIASNDNESEVWNISIGFVFRPGGHKGCGRYCRPLFNVADNGSMAMIRR